ncbi:MAG TPA: MarR family transcriptional regulator [Nocardioides sp.]|jgi:DNA-binding MarR family transcriptional regulator|uniref:MarR family winged helix-turn-helix transcriptional regulator n=1 Tax=Nocardioides sp. TaxID=35761 RepID=UPI002E2FB0D6|nr:MarR family transcriptional regulator [Nocardioides sp.]HEX3931808.1 MarR family transcriptional regulator [Nocardioides sp.]
MDAESVSRLRRAVVKLSRALNSPATAAGLTPTQASTLGLLANRGPMSLAALNDLEHLNPSMLSRVVTKLDSAGLIERHPDPADLRAVLVEATPRGETVSQTIRSQRTADVLSRLPALDAAQVRAITEALPALEALAVALEGAGNGG